MTVNKRVQHSEKPINKFADIPMALSEVELLEEIKDYKQRQKRLKHVRIFGLDIYQLLCENTPSSARGAEPHCFCHTHTIPEQN